MEWFSNNQPAITQHPVEQAAPVGRGILANQDNTLPWVWRQEYRLERFRLRCRQIRCESRLSWSFRRVSWCHRTARIHHPFVRDEFHMRATKRMALTCREVSEQHSIRAAHIRVKLMKSSSESVRRKPFASSIWFSKCSVNPIGRSGEHAVKTDCVCHCDVLMELEDEELQSANYRDHPPQAVDAMPVIPRPRDWSQSIILCILRMLECDGI